MLKFCYTNYADGIALGISGGNEQIVQFGNALFNFGGTEGNLNYMSEQFAYILTSKNKLQRCISAIEISKTNWQVKSLSKSERRKSLIWAAAEQKGKDFINNLLLEPFIVTENCNATFYNFPKECNIQLS